MDPITEFAERQSAAPLMQAASPSSDSALRRGVFRGDSSLGTWLDRIYQGKVVDYWRHRGRSSTVASIDGFTESEAIDLLPPTEDHEIVVLVREVLRRLPREHRVILILNRSERVSLDEIARLLGLSRGQVSRRLYAAEEMFRQLLRDNPTRNRMIKGTISGRTQ